jgi:hypothetical protein
MQNPICYNLFEKIHIQRPVNRIEFIAHICKDKNIIDIWCYDETGLVKQWTPLWLHGVIASQAKRVTWIDSSAGIPDEGIKTSDNSIIYKGELQSLNKDILLNSDILVAWELIEHIPNVEEFFMYIKNNAKWKKLICSTPNATAIHNVLLGLLWKESQHMDHVHIFSYKTLNTLCMRAWFKSWNILTYHVKFSEMILKASGIKKLLLISFEKIINFIEFLFPLIAWWLILEVEI